MLITVPRLGWILGFCAMASLGLPGLAGFWGEFPAILSAYSPASACRKPLFRTLMVIAAVGTVFAAAYLLWLYQRTAFGTPAGYVLDDDHGGHARRTGAGRDPRSRRGRQPARRARDDHGGHDDEHDEIHDVTRGSSGSRGCRCSG